MKPVSRTPDGWPNRCPRCGALLAFETEPTLVQYIQCANCFSRIAFVRLKGTMHSYVASQPTDCELDKLQRDKLTRIFPESIAREHHVCPMTAVEDLVTVMTTEPENEELRAKLKFVLNSEVHLLHAESDMIDVMIERQYREQEEH